MRVLEMHDDNSYWYRKCLLCLLLSYILILKKETVKQSRKRSEPGVRRPRLGTWQVINYVTQAPLDKGISFTGSQVASRADNKYRAGILLRFKHILFLQSISTSP